MRIPNYTQGLAIKRETQNTVDLAQISRAGDVAGGIGDLASVGFELAVRQKNASDMSAQNEAVIASKADAIDYSETFKAQNRESPIGASDRFKTEFKKLHEEKARSLPNDIVKQSYLREMDNLSLSYQREIKSWETETVVAQSVDKAKSSIDMLSKMALRGSTPEALRNDIDSTMLTLSDSVSESERIKLRRGAAESVAAMYYEGVLSRDVQTADRLLKSGAYTEDLSVEAVASLSKTIEAKKERLEKKYIETEQRRLNMKYTDPAGLAELDGAITPQQKIEKQQEYGVIGSNISVIPKRAAEAAVIDLNGIQDTDSFKIAIDGIRAQYGDDYYDIAMRDLKKNGLSEDITFLAQMNPEKDKIVMDAAFNMAKEGKNYADLAQARGILSRDISEAIEDRITEVRDVYLLENASVSGLNKKMESLATYFVAQGRDVKTAADLATTWFTNKVQVGSYNGSKFRVPSSYSPDDIEDALDYAFNSITPDDVNTIGTGEFSTDALKGGVKFVLGPNEEFYYLRNQQGAPVAKKDSKELLKFPIVDLIKAYKENRLKNVQKRSQQGNIEEFMSE